MANGLDVLLGDGGSAPTTGLDVLLGGTFSPQLPPPQVSPTGSFTENAAAGAGKFVSDTALGTKQLINDLAAGAQDSMKDTAVGRGIDWLNAKLGMQPPQVIQQAGRQDIAESRKLDAPLMDTGGGKVGYAAGALSLLPITPATSGYGGAAAVGATMGATQPAVSWKERGANTAFGAGAGAAGQLAANGIARVIQPQTSQAARDLMDAGVTLTPGQILGGGFKRAEEGATSVPIVGDFIKGAQNRQIAQLNQAVGNRALAPIGQTLPANVTGRDAVDFVGSKLGQAYDAILPNLTAQMDGQFAGEANNLARLVQSGNMGPQETTQFMSILRNNVLDKFAGQQSSATGDTLQAMRSDLARLASNYQRDPSFDKRQLGDAIGQLEDSVRGLVARQNPEYAPLLNQIDSGYAVFKRMQRAASSVAAEDGVFNPSQLQGAVRALDRSKDKGAFAKGAASLQDLSDPAKKLLAPKLADSGTPYRNAAIAIGAGALGHSSPLVGSLISPWLAAPFVAAPIMYSQPGQRLLQGLLTQRPAIAPALASAAGRVASPLSLMAPALTYAEQQ